LKAACRLTCAFLASPPLVVAYALKGTVIEDFTTTRSACRRTARTCSSRTSGRPTRSRHHHGRLDRPMFQARYADVYKGDKHWQAINVTGSETYSWQAGSTYVANPPYFEG
jgi:aconitate hydratase